MRRLLFVLLFSGCWHLLEPVAAVYEVAHPPPKCDDALMPRNGNAFTCVDVDGGYGGGPGHWQCVGPSSFDAPLCDGGTNK